MESLVHRVCSEMLSKLQDLEKKAQHDVVYYKGAREAVILVASEVKRLSEDQSGRQQQQPAAEATGSGKPKSSLSEIRSQRAKRQKADNPAE
jgi:hypothetical protein